MSRRCSEQTLCKSRIRLRRRRIGGGFAELGFFSAPAYNWAGATYLSLWYKVLQKQTHPEAVHLRPVLMDDSDCSAQDYAAKENVANYYSLHYILDDDVIGHWQEIRVELSGSEDTSSAFFSPTGKEPGAGNGVLDVKHVSGWRLEFSIDSRAAIGMGDCSEGVLLVDQLACVGGGDLFGSAFNVDEETFRKSTWSEEYFESTLSRDLSRVELVNGTLWVNYTVAQAENWGGFVNFRYITPGTSYYNLSNATGVTLNYTVNQAASSSDRVHLGLVLLDASNCVEDCDDTYGLTVEHYYSLHHVLDGTGTGEISVDLVGDAESSSPFWQTGWSGIAGNNVLDTAEIKGFRFEINVNGEGEPWVACLCHGRG